MKYILLTFYLLLLTGCPGNGPQIPICLSSGDRNKGCDGVDAKGDPLHMSFEQTKNWPMTSPDGMRMLLEHCKLKQEDDE